ncbi:MAG: LysM peptidoglycan-binding domain-containing protein [Firmicutes bacterium]|nr:LysM peptidoglycan-binding domain-containing protein [Bacillota bacterium]
MGNLVKIRASATSHVGLVKAVNEDNFYINGRFIYEHETDNIQVSIENNAEFYVFAVSDSMDVSDAERGIFISIAQELKKYHEKALKNDEDLIGKVQKLGECIQEMSNLLTSVSINKPEDASKKASFAGLLIQGNKAYVVNLGNSKAYVLRDGNMKQLTVDWEKTERLLKLGIITHEQAKILSSRFGIPTEDSINEIRKSDEFLIKEGDIFLLCTDGLTDMVETEAIYEILLSDKDTGVIANKLVREAFDNGAKDNITTLVVKIEEISVQAQDAQESKKTTIKNSKLTYRRIKKTSLKANISAKTIKKYAQAAIFCLVLIALVFATVKLFSGILKRERPVDSQGTVYNDEDSSTSSTTNDLNRENLDDGTSEQNTDEENINGESNTDTGMHAGEDGVTVNLPTTYKVKKGDTLYNISRMFYNNPNKYIIIMEENNISDPTKIQVGQILIIPEIDE